jgi:hypothetical protein
MAWQTSRKKQEQNLVDIGNLAGSEHSEVVELFKADLCPENEL